MLNMKISHLENANLACSAAAVASYFIRSYDTPTITTVFMTNASSMGSNKGLVDPELRLLDDAYDWTEQESAEWPILNDHDFGGSDSASDFQDYAQIAYSPQHKDSKTKLKRTKGRGKSNAEVNAQGKVAPSGGRSRTAMKDFDGDSKIVCHNVLGYGVTWLPVNDVEDPLPEPGQYEENVLDEYAEYRHNIELQLQSISEKFRYSNGDEDNDKTTICPMLEAWTKDGSMPDIVQFLLPNISRKWTYLTDPRGRYMKSLRTKLCFRTFDIESKISQAPNQIGADEGIEDGLLGNGWFLGALDSLGFTTQDLLDRVKPSLLSDKKYQHSLQGKGKDSRCDRKSWHELSNQEIDSAQVVRRMNQRMRRWRERHGGLSPHTRAEDSEYVMRVIYRSGGLTDAQISAGTYCQLSQNQTKMLFNGTWVDVPRAVGTQPTEQLKKILSANLRKFPAPHDGSPMVNLLSDQEISSARQKAAKARSAHEKASIRYIDVINVLREREKKVKNDGEVLSAAAVASKSLRASDQVKNQRRKRKGAQHEDESEAGDDWDNDHSGSENGDDLDPEGAYRPEQLSSKRAPAKPSRPRREASKRLRYTEISTDEDEFDGAGSLDKADAQITLTSEYDPELDVGDVTETDYKLQVKLGLLTNSVTQRHFFMHSNSPYAQRLRLGLEFSRFLRKNGTPDSRKYHPKPAGSHVISDPPEEE